MSVEVATAEITTLRPLLDLVGQIVAIPEKTAVISPQLGGWVSKLDVVEGQSVKADELLVELDTRSARVAVARAEATVAEKTAAVKRLKSGYLPEEIAGAKQDASNAAATADALNNELRALKDLLDRNEISPVVYQTKAEAAKSAEAALASAQEKVKLLEAGTRPEMVAEAQGQLDAAKADLQQANLTLDWCSITSPMDGVVVQLLARQGQFFDRAVSLATVMNLDEVFVQIRIPSTQFAKIREGTEIKIELASLPGRSFPGKVIRISGQADPATGNVVVFALVENSDHLLRPGLSCQVHVSLPEVTSALAIPVAAVADNSGTPVVTIIRNNKAYETAVTLGVETSDQVQILSGLKTGDQVATAGGYGLPEGCPVEIVDSQKNG
ncbi:efflux RND transporter periplasmic adaptor subunit [Stieleria neptunia]|uniref:efflux RND transporter periplasmic adaptor subunit n=1 Tax=Stieleria neptunia TaxID=2527979 RepID=UPI0018D24F40|nr:efflux RND transporter periplasmic adaptor subunit [Stieleria neptunia]